MNAPLDIPALKTRQQAAWSSGDYAVIGVTLQLVGESLCTSELSNPAEKVDQTWAFKRLYLKSRPRMLTAMC